MNRCVYLLVCCLISPLAWADTSEDTVRFVSGSHRLDTQQLMPGETWQLNVKEAYEVTDFLVFNDPDTHVTTIQYSLRYRAR